MIAGAVRPSQLITIFGPGSLVNLQNDTVMVLGLEFWPRNTETEKVFKNVSHPYLSQQLQKNFFQMLVSDDGAKIPCRTFPEWKLCQKCHRLQKPKTTPSSKGFMCTNCGNQDSSLYPVYFVQICDNGHISEFPWEEWAHLPDSRGDIKTCPKKHTEEPKLEFITSSKELSWFNHKVRCLYCNSERKMYNATSKGIFKKFGLDTCCGHQPWLQKDDNKRCNEPVYGIQVNSTATYYPFNATALLIPKWINDFDNLLDRDDGRLRSQIRDHYKHNKSTDKIFEFYEEVL